MLQIMLKKTSVILLLFWILSSQSTNGQVVIGGTDPDTSAVLDIQSLNKGVLLPRLSMSQRDAITLPATSLLIFNTTSLCVEVNVGTPESPLWLQMGCRSDFIDCGAYISPGVWKKFQCYNLGAANINAYPFTPSWEIMGGYWQWGRKNMAAPGPTAGDPNAGSIGGWNTTIAANGSWSDGTKTAIDPCPAGYRVPTKAQWDAVLSNNALTSVGTWTVLPEGSTNYSSGKMIGNKLFLPAAGFRYYDDGALYGRGDGGYYWSSTEGDSYGAWYLVFGSSDASTYYFYYRTYGLSVRCVAE